MSGIGRLAWGAAVALALLGPHALAADPAPKAAALAYDPNRIAPDPAVRTGVLPNGLRYAVMRNALPKGAVSIRLGIDVGSFEETLQIYLLGNPTERPDDDRPPWCLLIHGTAGLLIACIARRKDDACKRGIELTQRRAILLSQSHQQIAAIRKMLLGSSRFPGILYQQLFPNKVAGKIAGDLLVEGCLEVMRHLDQHRSP